MFDAIRALMAEPEKPKRKIGFVVKEKTAGYKTKREYVHSLRGKYKGKRLLKSLMAEKKYEKGL